MTAARSSRAGCVPSHVTCLNKASAEHLGWLLCIQPLLLGVDVGAGSALALAAKKHNKNAPCCRGFLCRMICSCHQPSDYAMVTARQRRNE